jgi:predicted ATPase/transcriptional regulator with XRE-family HTH domain
MFGEWLRQRRDGLGLTRKEFSRRVGCSISTLRKIEDGERKPSGQIAELMADTLEIPAAERKIFVRVARGELGTDHLTTPSRGVASVGYSPVSPEPAPRIKLPVSPTPLIGRQSELEELTRLQSDPQCRLLTLVGPGGIGKTRLAIEIAARSGDLFADGIYFVPLAAINSTRFLVPAIADALDFAFQSASSADPKTQLFNYLQTKQILLLVDNLEHLLSGPGIELFSELLANTLQVKVLSTSRESLGLHGEWVFEVLGLPVPDNSSPDGFEQDTSIELFIQRARRAHVGFDATPQDLSAILKICRLVDGMPLAIELAAAWARTLSCDEIAYEIERGLDFLSVNTRDLPARHRSMRAVFDQTWRLLSEDEKLILVRLSVFRGGFRREAAEQVAEATLSLLNALVTKSLIRRNITGRYDLHELIRQFAAEQNGKYQEEQIAVRASHGSYFLTYFGNADSRLRGPAQRETLAELTLEMENFRAAWDWAVTHGEFSLIEQAIRTIAYFYDIRGWLHEGMETFSNVITSLETSLPERINQITLGHALASHSVLESRLGLYEQAQAGLERSLVILGPLNEPRVLVESITLLGNVMEFTGNYARASKLYAEGFEMATTVGDRWFAALCLTCLIGLDGITDGTVKPEDTYERFQSVVADWRSIGDPRFTAIGLNILSWLALKIGHYEEASTALEESITLNMSVSDRWGLAFAHRGLGLIAQAQDEHTQAVDIFRKSLDMLTVLGARPDVARLLAEMSRSVFALGDEAEAELGWRESLRIANETRAAWIALEALVGIAHVLAKRGKIEQALELTFIVLNHPACLQETKDRADRLSAELKTQLTPTQVEAFKDYTGAKTFEVVVEDLLK